MASKLSKKIKFALLLKDSKEVRTLVELRENFDIDEIMDNVRTWYLYPQLQTRPLVISIWGLSGIGKTSLVKRISQLMRKKFNRLT